MLDRNGPSSNLLRKLGFGPTPPPPVGTMSQQREFFYMTASLTFYRSITYLSYFRPIEVILPEMRKHADMHSTFKRSHVCSPCFFILFILFLWPNLVFFIFHFQTCIGIFWYFVYLFWSFWWGDQSTKFLRKFKGTLIDKKNQVNMKGLIRINGGKLKGTLREGHKK